MGFFKRAGLLAAATLLAACSRTVIDDAKVLYIGVSTKATLEVMYNTARDELSLSGLKFNGDAQPRTFAMALVSNMCDKTKGLN